MAASACGPGLQVTACVVDVASGGFQCVNSKKKESFVTFAKGAALQCASPADTENFLVACKNHQVIQVTLCSVDVAHFMFNCVMPSGVTFTMAPSLVDNYFCMSAADRTRVIEHCTAGG